MNETRLPARAMYSYVEGTRSSGRQRKKWIDNVKEDLDFHCQATQILQSKHTVN